MEGVESESQSKHKDSQISPEMSKGLAETEKGFQQRVKEVLKTTTEESDKKISYLTTNLTELSSMHTALADQHRLLIEQVISDESKVKETNEGLLKNILNLEQQVVSLNEKILSLDNESTHLKVEIKENEAELKSWLEWAENYVPRQDACLDIEKSKVIELEKQRNNLLLLIEDYQFRFKSKEEELEASEKKLSVSRKLILKLKRDLSQVDQKLLDSSLEKTDSHSKLVQELQERVTTEVSLREDQTTQFNTKIDEYKCIITEMEVMNKLKEDIWKEEFRKLKVELTTKNSISAQLNKLQEENCSKDDLIQELETRLDSLQIVHVGVCTLIDDVQKVNNDLTLKVAKLKEKVIGSGQNMLL